MLSSDILEQQFGETKIIILKQDEHYRIIQTIVVSTGQVVELSLVTFDSPNLHVFADVHAQVIHGMSIGKAFKQAGVPFTRKTNTITRQVLPDILKRYYPDQEEVTVVDVDILVGNEGVHYCHILELYSSLVEWPDKPDGLSDQLAYALNNFSKLLDT